MPPYDEKKYSPPAPVALVTLRNSATSATVANVPMLVDTGADVTLLPFSAIEWLGVGPLVDQRYELIGFDGRKSESTVVILDLIFLRRLFHGRYLLINDTSGILGRDILNHIAMLMDGPAQQWSEISK